MPPPKLISGAALFKQKVVALRTLLQKLETTGWTGGSHIPYNGKLKTLPFTISEFWQRITITVSRYIAGVFPLKKRLRVETRNRFAYFLLEAQFFEEKAPYHVKPADNNTGRYGYDYTDYKSEQSFLFKPGAPSYHDLRYPVYTRDKKKDNLNQSALPVKPSHNPLLIFIYISIIPQIADMST